MSKIIVTGGQKLTGKVQISGAKNACLALLPATLLTEGESIIENVPNLLDVHTMLDLLRHFGCKVEWTENKVKIVPSVNTHRAPYEHVKKMRASFYVAGPLLARLGMAEVPLPGGCVIGSRPVNFHLDAFKQLGASVETKYGFMRARAKKLKGTSVILDPRFCSVGTTINLLMAAVLAEGETEIENAARDPEVVDLANFLTQMGADISGHGTRTIKIQGVERLKGTEHRVIPDRIEAGTFLLAGAITGGDVTVEGIPGGFVEALAQKLKSASCILTKDITRVRVETASSISPVEVTTSPYPGFPTDMQPSWVALMSVARGTSVVQETIHDARFRYVDELRRMGADIRLVDSTAVVRGVDKIFSAPVEAPDLRAGAALVLAGLAAEGETEIYGVEHIDRGYEKLEEKLKSLGAKITRAE